MSGIIAAMLPAIDGVLSVRDAAGAALAPVSFVTRTWTGTQPGDGTATDALVSMSPSPRIKNYAQDLRLREGGSVKAGDIILKNVSANRYQESDLDGTAAANVQKFYLVGGKLYQVISLVKKYVTWDVQLRELSNQTRY
jgi:hypothetical protein